MTTDEWCFFLWVAHFPPYMSIWMTDVHTDDDFIIVTPPSLLPASVVSGL